MFVILIYKISWYDNDYLYSYRIYIVNDFNLEMTRLFARENLITFSHHESVSFVIFF
jgi:uncharacterized protein affecting Mg2+/Co2+ transport